MALAKEKTKTNLQAVEVGGGMNRLCGGKRS